MKLTEKLLKEQIKKIMNEAIGRVQSPIGMNQGDSGGHRQFMRTRAQKKRDAAYRTQKDPELPVSDDSKRQAAQKHADDVTNRMMSTANDPAKASLAKTRKAKDALDQRLRGMGIYRDVVDTGAYVDVISDLEKMVDDKGKPFDGNEFTAAVSDKAKSLAPRSFLQKAGSFLTGGGFNESITLSSNDIRRMIQEEIINVTKGK